MSSGDAVEPRRLYPALASLPKGWLARLLAAATIVTLPAGATLFDEHES
jgi:hypothetical protein